MSDRRGGRSRVVDGSRSRSAARDVLAASTPERTSWRRSQSIRGANSSAATTGTSTTARGRIGTGAASIRETAATSNRRASGRAGRRSSGRGDLDVFVDLTESPFEFNANSSDIIELCESDSGGTSVGRGSRGAAAAGGTLEAPIDVDTPCPRRQRGSNRGKRAALSRLAERFLADLEVSSDDDDELPDIPAVLEVCKRNNKRKSKELPGDSESSAPEPKSNNQSNSTAKPENDAISCPICLETLSEIKQNKLHMMSGTCGHLLCSNCMNNLLADVGPKCPTCRKRLVKKSVHPVFI